MTISLISFSQGFIAKFLHKPVEYGNGQFGAFDIFSMLSEKLREVIVKIDVLIPFHNLDFTQVTHVGLYKEIHKFAQICNNF